MEGRADKAIKELMEYNRKLRQLHPSSDEISEYAKMLIDMGRAQGRLKTSYSGHYFGPRLHSTKRIRLHIDIGCSRIHLALDKNAARDFIRFIERRRLKAR